MFTTLRVVKIPTSQKHECLFTIYDLVKTVGYLRSAVCDNLYRYWWISLPKRSSSSLGRVFLLYEMTARICCRAFVIVMIPRESGWPVSLFFLRIVSGRSFERVCSMGRLLSQTMPKSIQHFFFKPFSFYILQTKAKWWDAVCRRQFSTENIIFCRGKSSPSCPATAASNRPARDWIAVRWWCRLGAQSSIRVTGASRCAEVRPWSLARAAVGGRLPTTRRGAFPSPPTRQRW